MSTARKTTRNSASQPINSVWIVTAVFAQWSRTATIEQHTHHKIGSAGSECMACHMPKIAQTLGDVNVRSHTFRFITPAMTDKLKIPNACNVCHTDKSTAWTTEALKAWPERSPWRVEQ